MHSAREHEQRAEAGGGGRVAARAAHTRRQQTTQHARDLAVTQKLCGKLRCRYGTQGLSVHRRDRASTNTKREMTGTRHGSSVQCVSSGAPSRQVSTAASSVARVPSVSWCLSLRRAVALSVCAALGRCCTAVSEEWAVRLARAARSSYANIGAFTAATAVVDCECVDDVR